MRNDATLRSSVNGYVPVRVSTPRSHRRQVITAVLAFDAFGQRATHREPHDDFGALETAELRVVRDGHAGESFGVPFEEIEKLLIPLRVVESGALAVNLV
jgi:hypothetical protein